MKNSRKPVARPKFEMGGGRMRRVQLLMNEFPSGHVWKIAAIAVLLTGSFAGNAVAQQKGQKTFASPDEAAQALFKAAQSSDEKALLELFGPDGKEIVDSGDTAADERSRANFTKRYEEMHRLVKEPDGTMAIYIGAHNWPYPVSLRNKGNVWYFDTEAGKQEILYRRVGFNEISAMRVCEELVAAQKEYYAHQNNQYASKIVSDGGKKDGLYWKASQGETPSPIGPLVASAVDNEAANGSGEAPTPYHGYYFHILTKQGKDAQGGAKAYLADGKMTGFAFVAFPAAYRSSGVMTFIVGEDGTIYQKDLGSKTVTEAKAMTEYDPGSGWKKVEDDQQETAGTETSK
jgi:hypothetical protein